MGREAEKSHPDEKTGCPTRLNLTQGMKAGGGGGQKYSGKGSCVFQVPGAVLDALCVFFHVILTCLIIPFFSLFL